MKLVLPASDMKLIIRIEVISVLGATTATLAALPRLRAAMAHAFKGSGSSSGLRGGGRFRWGR